VVVRVRVARPALSRIGRHALEDAGHRHRAEAQARVEEAANGVQRNRSAAILFLSRGRGVAGVEEARLGPQGHVIAETDLAHLKTSFASLSWPTSLIELSRTTRRFGGTERASNKTINNEVGTLRALLRRYRLWAQVAPDVRMLPVREDARPRVSQEEEHKLLLACAASRSRSRLPAVTTALSTGLRHEELRLLTGDRSISRTRR